MEGFEMWYPIIKKQRFPFIETTDPEQDLQEGAMAFQWIVIWYKTG